MTINDLNKIKEMEQSSKKQLIKQAITKIVQDKEVNANIKSLLLNQEYNSELSVIASEVIERISSKDIDIPSFEYLETKYQFLPNKTAYTQKDLYELLKQNFLQENITTRFYKTMQSRHSFTDTKKLKEFFDTCSNSISDLEDIKMASFGDSERMEQALKRIRDKSNMVYFGKMSPFNYAQIRTSQLIGILGASGNGKSMTLQKLHAESKNDVVLHFSLELNELDFLKRILLCLGWTNEERLEYLSDSELFYLKKRLSETFPDWHYLTLDTDSSSINLAKIEKMIKYYKFRYPNRVIKVFIDYVQLLEENWDANTCRVNKYLHDFAVRYDCCIIIGLQGNDEATKYEYPPELSHIAFVKSLKNDCDIIISQKATTLEEQPNITFFEYRTKKHRNGKSVNFTYEVDYEKESEDNWTLKKSNMRASRNIDLKTGFNKYDPNSDHEDSLLDEKKSIDNKKQ